MSKKALGKGLGALLSNIEYSSNSEILEVPIERLSPNPKQPRKYFDEKKLAELSSSIREKGVIQPIIVRKTEDGYGIVAGERRWRAAQKAGLGSLPVIVKDVSEKEELQISLIENIQREDINPVEEGEAYKRLIEAFQYTQEYVATIVGKDKTTISNMLRLLRLEEPIKDFLREGILTMGHARTLLSIDDPQDRLLLSKKIIQQGLSVRQTEKIVKQHAEGRKKKKEKQDDSNIFIKALEEELKSLFGAFVKIKNSTRTNGMKGRIEIIFSSSEELERIISIIRE